MSNRMPPHEGEWTHSRNWEDRSDGTTDEEDNVERKFHGAWKKGTEAEGSTEGSAVTEEESYPEDDVTSPRNGAHRAIDAASFLAQLELNALAKRNASLTDEVASLREELAILQQAVSSSKPPSSKASEDVLRLQQENERLAAALQMSELHRVEAAKQGCKKCAQSHVSAALWESVCATFLRLERQEVTEWELIQSDHHQRAIDVGQREAVNGVLNRLVVTHSDPIERCIRRWGK